MGNASMGPQLYRCGNAATHPEAAKTGSRFNGAATLPLRKCRSARQSTSLRRSRFNGAATLPLRKFGEYHPLLCPILLQLQWGRNFIVAETPYCLTSSRAWTMGFNGAATLSLRKRTATARHAFTSARFNGVATLSLRKPAAEIQHPAEVRRFNGAATLSLRKFGLVPGLDDRLATSMGPQLYRCGNRQRRLLRKQSFLRFNGAATLSLRKLPHAVFSPRTGTVLQWGRNSIVAENVPRCDSSHHFLVLQWGRNSIVAEN